LADRFLRCLPFVAALLVLAAPDVPAQAPAPPDLLIKGGRVIDPRNNVDGVLDVALSGGKVARVAANIQPAAGMRVIDATGLYVVPMRTPSGAARRRWSMPEGRAGGTSCSSRSR
jgi:hypothetical protein